MGIVPLIVHATRLLESMVVASSITSSASGKHSSKLEHIPYKSKLREDENITANWQYSHYIVYMTTCTI